MRNALGVLAVAAASVLWGCAAPAEVTTATLALHTLPSCDVAPPKQLRLRATGDFPAIDDDSDAKSAPITLDQFPIDTRYLAFEVGRGDSLAGGLATLPLGQGDVARNVLLLPYDKSCPLGDRLAVAAPGAALAALPDGGLLIAGGSGDDGVPVASAYMLPPGEALVREVAGGMLFRRAGASATLAGDRVVVAGGGQDDGANALANDSFEIYDLASGVFDKLQSDHLVESQARRDHGAALLGNGRVLLAGGCNRLGMTVAATAEADLPRCTATGAEPLANAEWIDPVSGKSIAIDGAMKVARVAPRVLVLDGGAVLIALGWDEAGALVPEVERFDSKAGTFYDTGVRLPERASAAVTALEGDRVLYAGCDAGRDCELALIVPDGDQSFTRADLPRTFGGVQLHDLDHLRLLPLHDGRVLLAARAASTRMRQAFIIDLNDVRIDPIDPADVTRVSDQLLELADGTRVEADSEGMSLARKDAQSPLDDAPNPVVLGNVQHLALDVASRWQHNGGLSTPDGARADLPFLRFADVRIALDLDEDASGTLLLEGEAAAPVAIELGLHAIALDKCSIPRAAKTMTIERHAGTLTLQSDDHRKRCDAPQLEHGRVGIAIRLVHDSLLHSLRVTRL